MSGNIILPDSNGRFGGGQRRRPVHEIHPQAQQAPVLAATFPMDGPMAEFHIQRHKEKLAKCPTDCGIDLYPMTIMESVELGERHISDFLHPERTELSFVTRSFMLFKVDTGVKTYCPVGSYGRLVSRSSSIEALQGAIVIDGTIDSGYIGWLFIRILTTMENADFTKKRIEQAIQDKRALAQLIPTPCIGAVLVKHDMSNAITPRGDKGFGSTDMSSQ